MRNFKFSRKYFIVIYILGFVVLVIYLTNSLRQYENPNAKIGELYFPNHTLKLFYSQTDKENTMSLYFQLINGNDKKLLYKNNPRFQHKLLKSSRKILILQSDGVVLMDKNGQNKKRIFTNPKGKRTSEESWQVSLDENFVSFMLYDDDYKVEPITYELNLETETYRILSTKVNTSYSSKNEATSPNGSKKASIKEGSLFVDGKELIHWPNFDYKFNPGCSHPQWLPFEDYLTVSCMGSLRMVQLSTGKNAELAKGGKVDWFD